jgi:hypothetical protein
MASSRKDWYAKHWESSETSAFAKWWEETYGLPEQRDEGDQEDYWTWKGLALLGWLKGFYSGVSLG